jgi:hypothetical protein
LRIPEDREAAIGSTAPSGSRKRGATLEADRRRAKLVEAFRSMDVPAIESLSAEIAYLAGELHMPSTCRSTGWRAHRPEGTSRRFDSRLLEVYGEKLQVPDSSSIYLDRPGEYAISFVRKSYVWVGNILLR